MQKYKFLVSILFFPFIYLMGWVIISIIIYPFPFLGIDKSLYGTIITFVIFLIVLPIWSKKKWKKDLSQILGIIQIKNKNLNKLLLNEIIKATSIIFFIVTSILISGYSTINFAIDYFVVLNSLFLGFFVGFAEELVFRVWLFEELFLIFNKRNANVIQALIFSLVHLRGDLNFTNNLQLLAGLFLLGLYLSKWRDDKYSSIFTAVCFHSSIVGIWFFVNSSFLTIQPLIPKSLFGPGIGNQINPIGGIFGIMSLLFLNLHSNLRNSKKIFLNKK